MSADPATHIPEDRIIQIIADGGGRATEQAHLNHCGHCRAVLTELQADLDRFRRRAALAAPAPSKRFVLPADLPKCSAMRRWRFGWAAVGTLLSVALLILFLRMEIGGPLPGLSTTAPPIAKWQDPEMVAVSKLAENPLPEAYLALSESLEGGYEEGFMDFLIPPLDGDPIS